MCEPPRSLKVRRIDKTLLEQMHISDVEISHRIELFGLCREELNQLASYKAVIENNVDQIVNDFYEIQTEIDEISLLIGDADTLSRLQLAQRKYVIDLFSGEYGSEYVNNRLRIGMVHKRIGVDPKLYLSAVSTLKGLISRVLIKTLGNNAAADAVLGILDRLFYFDITLVFDTYIDSLVGEIESAKAKTEIYATSLEEKVAERTRQLEELVKLDPLTNIYNQRAMLEVLNRELSVAKRRQTTLSFVYFDVDNFKDINDTYGHIKGDEVLNTIGKILLECVRESDVPCRYGGDEFCLILPECNIGNAAIVCEKIINKFRDIYPDFSLSIGIAEAGLQYHADSVELIKMADKKMYLAKQESGFQIRS